MKTLIKKKDNMVATVKSRKNALTAIFILLALFVYTHSNAAGPAANIRGPLVAHYNRGNNNVSLTTEISADASPVVSYTLVGNTSQAYIVTQGSLVYNSTTGVYTQTIVVNPGTSNGRFNIKLIATTPSGSTVANAGVTVIK